MAEKPKRIHLLGSGRHEEAVAAGAIKPGHLIKLDNAGKVVVHATDGGAGERLFALEDALQGKSITNAYAATDVVSMVVAAPGDVVYAYLAAGEDVDIGVQLSSKGDGTLQEAGNNDVVLAVALEAVDLSDSGAADGRIRARVV